MNCNKITHKITLNEGNRRQCLEQFKKMICYIDQLTTQNNNLKNNIKKYIENSKNNSKKLKEEITK